MYYRIAIWAPLWFLFPSALSPLAPHPFQFEDSFQCGISQCITALPFGHPFGFIFLPFGPLFQCGISKCITALPLGPRELCNIALLVIMLNECIIDNYFLRQEYARIGDHNISMFRETALLLHIIALLVDLRPQGKKANPG